jgi:hypothetical protein
MKSEQIQQNKHAKQITLSITSSCLFLGDPSFPDALLALDARFTLHWHTVQPCISANHILDSTNKFKTKNIYIL